MADADEYVEPHAPAMTKSERDARVAEVSRERGEEWERAVCEGAAAYRAVLRRKFMESASHEAAVSNADAELRRRFGEAFDRACKERNDA